MRSFVWMMILVPIVVTAEPMPEIRRDTAPAQAVGAVHIVRGIPEACVHLEGVFTGDTAMPYRLHPVRNPACTQRAKYVDAAKIRPSAAKGWLFNDLIRVPNAACPSQEAVIRVWRKGDRVASLKLDAQGRARIYLDDSVKAAATNKLPPITIYAAVLKVEGESCGQ